MKRFLSAFVVAVVLSAPLHAQSLVSVTLDIFQPGATAPFMSTTFVYTSTACGQVPPPVPATVINPTRISFADPADSTKACVFSQTAFLASIPIIPQQYTATVSVADDLGRVSLRSAASNPFFRLGPLAAPTGLKVIP